MVGADERGDNGDLLGDDRGEVAAGGEVRRPRVLSNRRETMRVFSRRLLACGMAVLLAGFAPPPARAEHTRQWRQATYEDFDKGTPQGVALRSDGKLVLAPRFAPFADPNAAYLWSLRVDSKGNLYAAGGSNAKVLRFDSKGAATTVFDSAEMTAQALALDAADNLYVGTSPDGKVYRITPAGEKKVFFEPKTKYIWALAVDANGTVYVATGDKGEIFAVKPDGSGQVFYSSEETHIRALALDGRGNLLAGTEPNGLILRISLADRSNARQAFVLYETSKKEVTALLVDRAGNTLAAAIGEKPRPGQPIPLVVVTQQQAAGGQPIAAGGTTGPAPQGTVFVRFPPMVGSAVYRLAPDGAPEELWSSRDELVYALELSPGGKLLLGTGNRGVVIELEGHGVFSSLVKTASSQVTSLAQGPGGKVYLCTANPGKIFTLGPDDEPVGTFESQTFDARMFSQWGRLEWWGENADSDGKISLYVRSESAFSPHHSSRPHCENMRASKVCDSKVPTGSSSGPSVKIFPGLAVHRYTLPPGPCARLVTCDDAVFTRLENTPWPSSSMTTPRLPVPSSNFPPGESSSA